MKAKIYFEGPIFPNRPPDKNTYVVLSCSYRLIRYAEEAPLQVECFYKEDWHPVTNPDVIKQVMAAAAEKLIEPDEKPYDNYARSALNNVPIGHLQLTSIAERITWQRQEQSEFLKLLQKESIQETE